MPTPPAPNSSVFALQDGVRAGLKQQWGSNEERQEARTEAFSLANVHGQPSQYVTLSPDSAGLYTFNFVILYFIHHL